MAEERERRETDRQQELNGRYVEGLRKELFQVGQQLHLSLDPIAHRVCALIDRDPEGALNLLKSIRAIKDSVGGVVDCLQEKLDRVYFGDGKEVAVKNADYMIELIKRCGEGGEVILTEKESERVKADYEFLYDDDTPNPVRDIRSINPLELRKYIIRRFVLVFPGDYRVNVSLVYGRDDNILKMCSLNCQFDRDKAEEFEGEHYNRKYQAVLADVRKKVEIHGS